MQGDRAYWIQGRKCTVVGAGSGRAFPSLNPARTISVSIQGANLAKRMRSDSENVTIISLTKHSQSYGMLRYAGPMRKAPASRRRAGRSPARAGGRSRGRRASARGRGRCPRSPARSAASPTRARTAASPTPGAAADDEEEMVKACDNQRARAHAESDEACRRRRGAAAPAGQGVVARQVVPHCYPPLIVDVKVTRFGARR